MRLIKGKHAICEYVGENHNRMLSLVESEELPAWRASEHGTWKAIDTDLDKWLRSQANRYLGKLSEQLEGER